MAKKLVMMPPAELSPREGDVPLSAEDYLRISLFARLAQKPSLDSFPGAVLLRHYRQGEVVCHQGAAGWTAFYVLTAADLAAVLPALYAARAADDEERALAYTLKHVGPLPVVPAGARALTVHIALAHPPESPTNLLRRLGRTLFGERRKEVRRPRYIPIDAPRDVEYDSREAAVYEGELIGEMSCLYGSPRSATVVADRDCYLLEVLRSIFDKIQKDKKYQEEMDRVYKERVLQGHLRRLSIFDDLTDDQFARIQKHVELVRCTAGDLICEEHDRPGDVHVIRTGLVQVVKHGSSLVAVGDVRDWAALCGRLRQGEQEQAGPLRQVWDRLGVPGRDGARRGAGSRADRQAIAYGLNDFIKGPPLPDPKNPKAAAELPDAASPGALTELVRGLHRDPKQWTEIDRRRFGRLYLEAVFPGLLEGLAARAARKYILSYLSQGDFIGEISLLTGGPRTATCVAFVHPEPGDAYGHPGGGGARWRSEKAMVELVKIPGAAFRELLDKSPAVRARIEEIAAARRRQNAAREAEPAWDEPRDQLLGGRFKELGLIQGQKLMLIDLDRCTRCDECVRACVNTHDDGRSRLFLDGPRYGKYLVPATCRSCLDPVCLIGCPVGSIHRGDNREIRIEDWCIGCGLCADTCPYGSIQMHDIGVIPEEGYGWYFCPAAAAGDGWMNPKGSLRHWCPGKAPFVNDLDFRAALGAWPPPSAGGAEPAVCFRRDFSLDAARLRTAAGFTLELTAPKGEVAVYVNGARQPDVPRKDNTGKRTYAVSAVGVLRGGRNTVAVRVTPGGADREVLLALRLDEVRMPDVAVTASVELSEKKVESRAVVCDLCSDQYGQRPACVTACPHDAALRVNARFEFPDP